MSVVSCSSSPTCLFCSLWTVEGWDAQLLLPSLWLFRNVILWSRKAVSFQVLHVVTLWSTKAVTLSNVARCRSVTKAVTLLNVARCRFVINESCFPLKCCAVSFCDQRRLFVSCHCLASSLLRTAMTARQLSLSWSLLARTFQVCLLGRGLMRGVDILCNAHQLCCASCLVTALRICDSDTKDSLSG